MGTDFKLGIDNNAKPVIQASIGIDNQAKPIIAGWIGVDNKAKPFFSGGVGRAPYSKVFPDGTMGWYNGSSNISIYKVYRRTASSSTYTLDGTYNLASRMNFVKDRTYDYRHTFSSSIFNRQDCYIYKIVCYNSNGKELCTDGPHYVPWVGFEFDQTYLNYNGTIYYLSGAMTSDTTSVYGVQRYGYKYSGWYTGSGGSGIKYVDSYYVSIGNNSYVMERDKYYNSEATYIGNYNDIIKLYPAFSANYWEVDLDIGNGILVDSNNTEYTDQILRVYVDKDQNTLGTCRIKANNLSLNSLTPSDYTSGGYRYTFRKWANRNGTAYSSSSTINNDFLDGSNPLTAIYDSALILTTPTITSMDLTDNTHNTSTTVSGHSASNVYIYFKSPTDGDISYIIATKYQQDGTEYTGNMINTSVYNNYSYSLKMVTINVTTNQIGIRAVDTSGNQQEVKITTQWYKILVSVNGGNESNPDITYRFQAYYPINSGENLGDLINFSPTKSGYAFKGWYIYKNGFTSKRVYTYTTMDELDSSSYYTTDSSYSYLRDVSIYAKWEEIKYTVTIYRNGADSIGFYRGYVIDDSSTDYKTYEVPAGTALSVIMPTSASRAADSNYIYAFNSGGLATSASASSVSYSTSYSINQNLTLYVVWTKQQTYMVDINYGDADSLTFNDTVYTPAISYSSYHRYYLPKNTAFSYVMPKTSPTKSGYTFTDKWRDNNNNNVEVTSSTLTGYSGNTFADLYPVFEESSIIVYVSKTSGVYQEDITFKTSSASGYDSSNSNSTSKAYKITPNSTTFSTFKPTSASRYGYTLSGYGYQGSSTTTISDSTTFSTSKTIVPKWTSNYVTLSFNAGGGSGMSWSSIYVETYTQASNGRTSLTSSSYSTGAPTISTKPSNTLGNWYLDSFSWVNSGGNVTSESAYINSNMTWTATWNKAKDFNISYSGGGKTISWTPIPGQRHYFAFKYYGGIWYFKHGSLTDSTSSFSFNNSNIDGIILVIMDKDVSFTNTSNSSYNYSYNNCGNVVVMKNGNLSTSVSDNKFEGRGARTMYYSSSSTPLGNFMFSGSNFSIDFTGSYASSAGYTSNAKIRGRLSDNSASNYTWYSF